jgi:hypothetical protein
MSSTNLVQATIYPVVLMNCFTTEPPHLLSELQSEVAVERLYPTRLSVIDTILKAVSLHFQFHLSESALARPSSAYNLKTFITGWMPQLLELLTGGSKHLTPTHACVHMYHAHNRPCALFHAGTYHSRNWESDTHAYQLSRNWDRHEPACTW